MPWQLVWWGVRVGVLVWGKPKVMKREQGSTPE